ncbi:MAG: hypothetical protein RMZ41_007660 [Nostoc sp. DedVER02]|uniref:hypothetical protein n=1 Tax=unclassified Nostoc TaxID=2593658 RepID=UPI002AD3805F|nr:MULTISPECIES: hypothetical protein [unclassified Nostoc]MDZ7985419.1 hypothetical protein [Nostoc sp. DedVER02]MDZ8116885.1 hypothetical protein [Nostoc sp. DedVER01b]
MSWNEVLRVISDRIYTIPGLKARAVEKNLNQLSFFSFNISIKTTADMSISAVVLS